MIYEPLSVLLAEDDRDDERLALRALRACGLPLCVQVARDGEEALRALGLEASADGVARCAFDLVISDLKMPKLNGDEVLSRARADARLREVPYVVFSSSDEAEDVRRCLALGATEYVAKPVDYEVYLACVGALARRWLAECAPRREPFCVLDAGCGVA